MNTPFDGPLDPTQTQRVFVAMRDLEEFTVSRLAHASGVNPNTVRTILFRHQSLLEEVGREETGRRGGQSRRYRLTLEGREYVSRALPALVERKLSVDRGMAWKEGQPFLPESLRAARDTLTRRLAEEGSDRRPNLLQLARVDLRAAQLDIDEAHSAGHDVAAALTEIAQLRGLLSDLAAGENPVAAPAERTTTVARNPATEGRVSDLMLHLLNEVNAGRLTPNDAADEFRRRRTNCQLPPRMPDETATLHKMRSTADTLMLEEADVYYLASGARVYMRDVLRVVEPATLPGRQRRGAHTAADVRLNIAKYWYVVATDRLARWIAPIEQKLADWIDKPVASW